MSIYKNPIKKQGDFADPFVLRHNGMYYLYATNPDVRCWSSDDLVNWSLEGSTVPQDEFPDMVPFAPEVVYWNGAFYMYTSPHGLGHYVLKSDSPTGPFRKITGNLNRSIDMSVFIDDDGQWYAYWADERGIVGCKMLSPTKFGKERLVGAYLHGWTEGPFVVKKDGKYHLTYTGNHFLSKGYRIHAAIANTPLGPYREDDYNPIAVSTEGDTVGLGHSSTVLGPDLSTYYLLYHNLNPDKTRDLNIDPIVLTKDKAYFLGPTATSKQAPSRPVWRRIRPHPKTVRLGYAENRLLTKEGIAEFNLAAHKGTDRYGIEFTGTEITRLEFDVPDNTVSVIKQGSLIACEKLLSDYAHKVLHCIRIEYAKNMTVYIDNLKRLTAKATPALCKIYYYANGELQIGSVTAAKSRQTEPCYHVPGFAPGDRKILFEVDRYGTYQLVATDCKNMMDSVQIDEKKIAADAVDTANSLLFFSCNLDAGRHLLQTNLISPKTIALAHYYDNKCRKLTVRNLGPFDKCHGPEPHTNTAVYARLKISGRKNGWQAGIIVRGNCFSDGGEGDDKILGTNFFIGYRICAADGKVQIWKHRYDEHLLIETAFKNRRIVTFKVITNYNLISVFIGHEKILEYSDSNPILYGYNGFHTRQCIIQEGIIYRKE